MLVECLASELRQIEENKLDKAPGNRSVATIVAFKEGNPYIVLDDNKKVAMRRYRRHRIVYWNLTTVMIPKAFLCRLMHCETE